MEDAQPLVRQPLSTYRPVRAPEPMAARSVPGVVLAALLTAAPLALALPVPAPPLPLVVALPGAWLTNYATPAAVATEGGTLTFVNLDLMTHNVVAFNAYGPGDQPWCINYVAGQCPLFWSRIIGFGEQVEVQGLDNIVPGSVYSYYCAPHPAMRGTLVALPAVPA